jgi:poly(hydroxyalkanoate) granule-associated protein
MSKQIKAKRPVKAVRETSEAQARRFWLAGLGAVSYAQKQGGIVFDGLVDEGRRFQARSSQRARQLSNDVNVVVRARLKPLQARFEGIRNETASRLEHGFGRVLSYAGIPSKSDVDTLISRIDSLSRQLRSAK